MFVTRTPVKRRLGEIPIVVAVLVALFATGMPLASAIHDVSVSPTSGLITTESGLTAAFSVALTELPSGDVTIGVSSSDTTEGTVSTAQLTFTTTNWMDAQVVTVTGVDDLVDDGDTAYTVVLATAVGGGYDGIDPTDVTAINTDNDTAGITVTPTTGLVTTETRTTATFSVALNSEPTANVSIGVASSDTSEGTVSTAQLTFTTTNWSLAQTVTVTGVDDFVDDGDIGYTVILATAAGGGYDTINPDDVSVTNTDDDTAGFTVAPTSGLVTTEAGGVALFTVAVTSQPTGDVTVAVTSNDTTEGTVSPVSLTFTTANWEDAQTVTVTGVNDLVDDGDIGYSVVLGTATGGGYDTIDPADVTVTNTDNDTAGTTVTPTSGLVTTETGTTATFTVALNSEPTANVSIGVTSSDTSEGTVSPVSLTFTTTNWSVAQTVTVTGVDDLVDEGDIGYTLILATATGGGYDAINPDDVTVTNTDNDTAGITVTPTSGLVTTETGTTATFTVALNTEPTADVSIGVSSSDTSEGTVSPASLTFTTTNWSVAQTVTVTGVNDFLDDGDIGYTLILATATGGGYDAVNPADVTASNSDNDAAGGGGVVVTPPAGLVDTSEACPDSIATSGFADLAGFDETTIQAIDCIFGYGISNGTSDVNFTPSGSVTRWQMALFLIRQIQVHGLVLPTATDQGFTDLGSYNQTTKDAISQLAQLGITQGTGNGTFSPGEAVSRWEMALFLVRFVAAVGVTMPDRPASAGFSDLSSFTAETTAAVDLLVELGIAAGTSATTFEPADDVLRWHMALFLTRVLAVDGVVPS